MTYAASGIISNVIVARSTIIGNITAIVTLVHALLLYHYKPALLTYDFLRRSTTLALLFFICYDYYLYAM